MRDLRAPLLAALLVVGAFAIPAQATSLVGHWTFQPGQELVDLTGNWSNLELHGATVSGGALDVDRFTWAHSLDYSGPAITEKTLVAWVALDNLDIRNGSALTLDRRASDSFDGIIYAERIARNWMPGSSFFLRTLDPVPGHTETTVGELVQLAISYENSGGSAHVRVYRNGLQIGDYTKGPIATWFAGNAEAIFGARHTNGDHSPRLGLDGKIHEARIYTGLLTGDDLASLTLVPEPSSVALFGLGALMLAATRRRRGARRS